MATVGGGGLSETMCCLLITHDFSVLHSQTERCASSGSERQMVKEPCGGNVHVGLSVRFSPTKAKTSGPNPVASFVLWASSFHGGVQFLPSLQLASIDL